MCTPCRYLEQANAAGLLLTKGEEFRGLARESETARPRAAFLSNTERSHGRAASDMLFSNSTLALIWRIADVNGENS